MRQVLDAEAAPPPAAGPAGPDGTAAVPVGSSAADAAVATTPSTDADVLIAFSCTIMIGLLFSAG